jgi:predicted GNAT family acetyltransferase
MTDTTPANSITDAAAQPANMVTDNLAQSRFELSVDGSLAYAVYQRQGQAITFIHTFVPSSLRGRGIATQLILAGLASSRARGLEVIPQCPLFRAYMKKHGETHDLLGPEGRALIAE